MSARRLFVTGASGQLGEAIVRAFADWDIVAPTRAALDISSPTAVATVVAAATPSLVVNCAAFNDVDGAESSPDGALAVNAFAVRSLARAADGCGATFVHYGTDFVFDGLATEPYNEASPPSPRSSYAASKLLGEWFAGEARRGFVLRVESLFGKNRTWAGRTGTLDGIVRSMCAGQEVRAFTDRVVTPSYVEDVAAATRALVETAAAPGFYHCVNSGQATWHEIVSTSARILGITPRITAITTADVVMKAARPRYCALSNDKLRAAGFAMPTWQNALERWLGTFSER